MFSQVLKVTPSAASCGNEMKLRSLLNYLQDIAGLAVEHLESTPSQMLARGYGWVLLKYELELIRRLPSMDESFKVNTWHDVTDGYYVVRVFQVENMDGEPLAWAKTSWLLMDLVKGRPIRASNLPEPFIKGCTAVDPEFHKFPEVNPEASFHEVVFPVRFHDLDSNDHVNNAVYFEWAFESTPLDLMAYTVKSMSADFRSGVRYGDVVKVRVTELPSEEGRSVREFIYEMVHSGEQSSSKPHQKPLARFYAVWEAVVQ